ncbi:MAG: DsrE family protein [Mailhella sp.]|nr:DsrE family protein [Mailhella sp.]
MKNDLLIHVNVNDPEVFEMAFGQAAHYRKETLIKHEKISAQDFAWRAGLGALEQEDRFKVVMVVNGPAVKQLVKENAELLQKAQEAVSNGLKILAGKYAVENAGLAREQLWSFVEIVPSATQEIVELQSKGFAYMKA